jgi:hypothetical protein
VRSGDTDVLVGRDYTPLRSGQSLIVGADPSNPTRNFVAFAPYDEWDRWNDSRDRDLERSDSYKYVSRDIYGADDLDRHGRWVYDSPYGWVWAPTVAAGWAPYRDGRWYYADYYGWTWVSSDPWGWAPYHYGRWYNAPRYGWVWYPGTIGPRYYWRPALVSFFGWGGNVGGVNLAFGFGNVGWVPLAPYEVYRPWYGRNVTVVNVIHDVNVVNVYRNARYVNGYNGVTSVVAGDFGRRRVNGNDFVRANDRDLLRAGDVRGRVPFDASRESRRLNDGPDRRVNARNNGGTPNTGRTFVSTPPAANLPRQDNRPPTQVQPPRSDPRPRVERSERTFEPRQQPAQPPRGNGSFERREERSVPQPQPQPRVQPQVQPRVQPQPQNSPSERREAPQRAERTERRSEENRSQPDNSNSSRGNGRGRR